MKINESGEMYLENILVLRDKLGRVRSIDIVNYTGYSKPSISRALGNLRREEMVSVDENGYITLSEKGEARARKIYERHLILSDFFKYIGVDDEVAASDACKIEHDLSDETFEKIKLFIEALRTK